MRKSSLLLLIFILISPSLFAQILDDSTKQIYGPKTTDFLFEEQFIQNDTSYSHPDTTLANFHYFNIANKNLGLYQDLGNEGTAAKYYYIKKVETIYTEPGYDAFKLYETEISKIKYYRTRSPFTNMAYTQSTNGLGKLGFTHAQNISPNWNFALDVNRITSSKQYSAQTREDRLVDHWDFTFNTNFKSKNSKYQLLADFLHFNHKQIEQGGIVTSSDLPTDPTNLLADYKTNYQQLLSGINNRERRNNIHLMQQYKFASGFQAFHILDMQRQKYFYNDNSFSNNYLTNVYGTLDSTVSSIDTLRTYNRFQNLQNKLGFKGQFNGFNYVLSLTQRLYSLKAIAWAENSSGLRSETVAALDAGYRLKEDKGQLSINAAFSSNAAYLIGAHLKVKDFNLEFRQSLKPVSLRYQAFDSEIINWNNDFKKTFTNQFTATYSFKNRRFEFAPGFNLNVLDNYIYFDQFQKVTQNSGVFSVLDLNLFTAYHFNKISLSNFLVFANSSNSAIYRLPEISNNTNIEWELLYAKKLKLYIGADILYRSQYLADTWSPFLQTFYLQNNQKVQGYPLVNAYINFMIKTVKLAFGFDYLNQGIPTNGYYTTPGYLGMSRTFYIKVNWPLFD